MFELRTTYKATGSSSWVPTLRRPQRLLAPTWTMLPLAARTCRVRNPISGAIAELSADQYAILTACEGCKTIEEHGATIRRKFGVPDQDWPTISQWLNDFAARGMLTSLEDLAGRFDPVPNWAPATFAGVFIRTCDRPELLARALRSAATLERRTDVRHHYEVLDDSRDAANIALNRKAVIDSGLDCVHVDLSQHHPVVRALRDAFPSATAEIDWLFGIPVAGESTYGRPINFALLLTAGRRVLMLDDDAVLDPRWAPIRDRGLEVSSSSDELFSFEDAAKLDQACGAAAIDPIASHLDILGAPAGLVWSLQTDAANGPVLAQLNGEDAARFTPDARIITTQNHTVGDPGSALFPYHLLTLPVASTAQLLQDPARLAAAFHHRHNWRGHTRARLTPNRPLTFTTLAGLDNSAPLPPTVRANRNEDLLLGDMIRYVHADSWSFDLPWALPHWRNPPKHWLHAASSFPQEPVHFLMDVLEKRGSSMLSKAPGDRMRSLGDALLDLASTGDHQLDALLEQQAADTASRVCYAIRAQLDDAALPAIWKDHLRPWLDSPTLATDPEALRRRVASADAVRAMARNYGRALTQWPQIWRWAMQRNG